MAKILTPKQAAHELGKDGKTGEEWLRRHRKKNDGPPYVMHGSKPRYRSDLIQPGTYDVQGLQTRFPAPKTELRDMTGMSEAKQAMLREMIDEMPVMPLEDTDDLVFVADGLDTSDPQVQAVIRTLGTMVRQNR